MKGGVIAVVPSAGIGARLGAGVEKPFVQLLGRPLILWSLSELEAAEEISEIIPVIKEEAKESFKDRLRGCELTKMKRTALGGKERQDSVSNALALIDDPEAIVLIHDGARPLLSQNLIRETIEGLEAGFDGSVAAVPPKDTIKRVDEDGVITSTLDRMELLAVQTPQVFRLGPLMEAHKAARRDGFVGTDDAMLVERIGGRVRVVMGEYENLKVTTPEDIAVAEALLRKRR